MLPQTTRVIAQQVRADDGHHQGRQKHDRGTGDRRADLLQQTQSRDDLDVLGW